MVKARLLATLSAILALPCLEAFALVPQQRSFVARPPSQSTSALFLDATILEGAGIAIAGLAIGIGMVAFTEAQGERAKERGAGLSESMATKITGQLMEDVEVSSVSDLGSLTSQLEAALKETAGADNEELEMTEEQKQQIVDDAGTSTTNDRATRSPRADNLTLLFLLVAEDGW